jgi:hypothetical protein
MCDLATAELVQRLRTGPDAAVFATPRSIAPLVPVIDIEFSNGDGTLRWFSIISTTGTPLPQTRHNTRTQEIGYRMPAPERRRIGWRDPQRTACSSRHRVVGVS